MSKDPGDRKCGDFSSSKSGCSNPWYEYVPTVEGSEPYVLEFLPGIGLALEGPLRTFSDSGSIHVR